MVTEDAKKPTDRPTMKIMQKQPTKQPTWGSNQQWQESNMTTTILWDQQKQWHRQVLMRAEIETQNHLICHENARAM